jgi:hypothetical protein
MAIINRDLILIVREMLDRHWDVYEIASKCKIDVAVVQAIIDMLT